MKRLVAGIVILLVAGSAIALAARSMIGAGPIYSVPQIDAVLRSDPVSLVGHVVRVRGVVGFCPVRAGCPSGMPPILNAWLGNPSPDPPLQLDFGPGDPLLAALRGLPVVGPLVPARRPLTNDYQGVLRVRIEPTTPYDCYTRLCYEGVLQDLARP